VDWVLIAVSVAGTVQPARRAFAAAVRGRLDINGLMVLAVIGAMAIGEYAESATVVVLFGLAQWMETRTVRRARMAIRALLQVAPEVVRLDDDPEGPPVPVGEVAIGTCVRILPGERVPVDGTVVRGDTDVNQAPITGESTPIDRHPGDEVFAGTINGHGAMVVRVTRPQAQTMLARMVHLIEDAQARRAPVQQFIDRFAQWYTPAIVAVAAGLALVPWVWPGVDRGAAETWLYRGLVTLVVGCPCALVIATPVSLMSALASAARHGVLIKGGAALERLAGVRVVAFDKTGTLTHGEVAVRAVVSIDAAGDDDVLALAAAVERYSDHPIARAVVGAAREKGLAVPEAHAVRVLPGLGVSGVVRGRQVHCGSPRSVEQMGAMTPDVSTRVEALVAAGTSPMVVVCDGRVTGVVAVADRARASAAVTVAALRALGVQTTVMLTGDHAPAAMAIARDVGLDHVEASLLPGDKVRCIEHWRQHGPVAMVGDGINDAPALAAADVGVVMGVLGSGAAVETADIALMTDDLPRLASTIRLGRATLGNIRINVAIALGLKLAFVVAAALGVATLWMAMLADTGASVIVVAHALRLRWFQWPDSASRVPTHASMAA
jgi:Cd2+/Zn2+-exporting ATPase